MNSSIESMALDVSDQEMLLFQQLFREHIGLYLPFSKKALLCSRLSRRLGELSLCTLKEYHSLISLPHEEAERQRAIDLITTNETYFFREQKHFDALRDEILPQIDRRHPLKVWSAASSTGEEAYSIAMVLDDHRGQLPWSILASDISQRVLSFGRRALYPMVRGELIAPAYLSRYCLRGTGEYEGHFLVDQKIRKRVSFEQRNLLSLPADMDGQFDVVFLRNVIIYFDFPTKVDVLRSVVNKLRPGGWLIVGHSESLHGMPLELQMHAPSIYRRLP
ncbi:SAM-dependent methyltransferase [Herbaspirillum hiltneri N3]|uniref:Chemotaxis protein methyltransferase n=1 Tax=Herbaspirillum hiltneri N3 TaxID=1262470 RepID=A0ABM5UYP2_9BURK|nr:protein-glutamate O-methyltransferase CheR [Herbaspirillum hiltneri]AKZ62354.1 SAM-dependent methyltransferase [Herbaspirillum hiltneri N3]